MISTHDAPAVSEESTPRENTIPFSERRHNAFLAQSRSAIGPEGFLPYLTERREHWPKASGFGAGQPKKKNAYHRERHATRGCEALRPGAVPSRSREHVNRNLDALRFAPCQNALRKPPPEDPRQKRVLNREHRHPVTKKKVGRFEWTTPTRWRSELMGVLPEWVITTNMLLSSQKVLLAFLYRCIDRYELHTNGQFIVRGVTQSFIGHHLGLTPGHISKLARDLERKGFLERRRPDFAAPLVYYLARYENSAWTYPALSRFSGRARLSRIHGPHEEIDWEKAVGGWLPRRKKGWWRRRKKSEKDEAEEKLERDRQRQRTSETGLHSAGDLFGAAPPRDPPEKPPDRGGGCG